MSRGWTTDYCWSVLRMVSVNFERVTKRKRMKREGEWERVRERNVEVPLPLLEVEEKTGEEILYQFQCRVRIGVCIGQQSTLTYGISNELLCIILPDVISHTIFFWRFTRADKELGILWCACAYLHSSRFRNFYEVSRKNIHCYHGVIYTSRVWRETYHYKIFERAKRKGELSTVIGKVMMVVYWRIFLRFHSTFRKNLHFIFFFCTCQFTDWYEL